MNFATTREQSSLESTELTENGNGLAGKVTHADSIFWPLQN